jgi:hypothetical protein
MVWIQIGCYMSICDIHVGTAYAHMCVCVCVCVCVFVCMCVCVCATVIQRECKNVLRTRISHLQRRGLLVADLLREALADPDGRPRVLRNKKVKNRGVRVGRERLSPALVRQGDTSASDLYGGEEMRVRFVYKSGAGGEVAAGSDLARRIRLGATRAVEIDPRDLHK